MWFTENAWPPMLVFGIVAAILLAAWIADRRALFLRGTLLMVALGLGTFLFERAYVTEGELLEARIRELAAAFQQQDEETMLGMISPQADVLQILVKRALDLVEVRDDLNIKDIQVEFLAQDSRARTFFRANGRFIVSSQSYEGHQATAWELTWQRENDQWKVIDVQRIHPITREKLGVFEQM